MSKTRTEIEHAIYVLAERSVNPYSHSRKEKTPGVIYASGGTSSLAYKVSNALPQRQLREITRTCNPVRQRACLKGVFDAMVRNGDLRRDSKRKWVTHEAFRHRHAQIAEERRVRNSDRGALPVKRRWSTNRPVVAY
jgi:hypothetical protein